MSVKKHIILILIIFCGFSSCSRQSSLFDINSIKTYRDIPGITQDEITAIEKIKSEFGSFTYGQMLETEAYILPDGTYAGFAIEFCRILSGLFDIEFDFEFHELDSLIAGLADFNIDFTGDLSATRERRLEYFMTHSIAERSNRIFTLKHDYSIMTELDTQDKNIGYLSGSVDAFRINQAYPELRINFTAVNGIDEAVNMMRERQIAAFVASGVVDPQFAPYYDYIKSKEFFPLVYNAVSLTTANPELLPVINAVDKYLAAGGVDVLYDLYLKCRFDYEKNKLNESFTRVEQIYIDNLISNNHTVKIGFQAYNYPVSFYNRSEGRYEGIACDILDEISKLTGIKFEIANNPDTNWSDLLNMLEKGEISLLSQLVQSPERTGSFLWADTPYVTASYALISKAEYPNIANFQVVRTRVGAVKDSIFEEKYYEWFPDNANLTTYATQNDVLVALEKGEIDLLMGTDFILLMQQNYYQKPGYKINIPLHAPIESYFGFNINQSVLCSIVCKALAHINTDIIVNAWTNRGYDYVSRLNRQRLIFIMLIAAILVFILILLMFFNRRLNRLVKERTVNLEHQTKAAEAAVQAKSIFLASMSHEIRTPMNAILGITEIQLQNTDVQPETLEALENIYDSGNLLLHIINDILDLSKIDAGKLEIITAQYDIPSLINDTVHINIMRYNVKPIDFHLDINPETPLNLIGDEFRIKQILNNILSNAFKYTEEGEIVLSIYSEEAEAEDEVILVLRVSDTGQGLREDQLERLFEEYSRFNMETNQGITGTGLGLSITKRLANLMNGEIYVESRPGKGSVFTVRIPQKKAGKNVCGAELAAKISNYEYQSKSISKRTYIPRQNLSHGSVLIVDDVSSNLYVAKGLLLPYGLKIETTQSGLEAIEKIKNGSVYDLILMDHMMPKMNGMEAVKILREMGYKKPIVALTANAIVGQEGLFLQNGFDGFITKPIDSRELDQVLLNFIHSRKRNQNINLNENINVKIKLDPAEVRKFFLMDAEKAVMVLEDYLNHDDKETKIDSFEVTVHGMKSALINIGENELSGIALKLEKAVIEKDFNQIEEETPYFLKSLKELIIKYNKNSLNDTSYDTENNELSAEDKTYLNEKLMEIKTACESFDTRIIRTVLEELKRKTWPAKINELIDEINVHLLHSSFKKLAMLVKNSL